MSKLIKYSKMLSSGVNRFKDIPRYCPQCNKYWKPEPPPLIIMKENWLGAVRMAEEYCKNCEFCGHRHSYWG